MRDLEGVALAAVAGEMRAVGECGRAWCLLIKVCARVGDVPRASQWCDTVLRLAERIQHPQLLASCLSQYASVLTARGDYAGAEVELEKAVMVFAAGAPGVVFEAELVLAELRRRQGRLEESVELAEAHAWHPSAQLVLSEVAWDRGDVAEARSMLDRRSRRTESGAVDDPAALLLAVRLAAAEGNGAAATAAVGALRAFAERAETVPLKAAAIAAEGFAGASPRASLQHAADLWTLAGMAYEAARAETALAVLSGDDALRARAVRRLACLGCSGDVGLLDSQLAPGACGSARGELSRLDLQVLRSRC
ncbi:MAG: hypothetical protein ABSH51_14395 [Solirubrobacteraceae bacterium]|jgi:Tfp pilus assembly protein PilF